MYFKVDDKLHDHRKTRRARKADGGCRSADSIGLWVLAGSWCMANGTDGFVPTDELDRWDDNGPALAERLVAAELWHPAEQDGEVGYQFHEWDDWQHSVGYINERRRRNADWMRTKRANQGADLQEQGVREHSTDTARTVGSTTTQPQPKNNTPAPAGADRFPDFWAAYPRRVRKAAAAKVWLRVIKDTDPDAILAGLGNANAVWTSSRTEPQFIPHPATWLNQGGWADEVPLPDMPPAGPVRTAHQCDDPKPHPRHQWDDPSNAYVCLGEPA